MSVDSRPGSRRASVIGSAILILMALLAVIGARSFITDPGALSTPPTNDFKRGGDIRHLQYNAVPLSMPPLASRFLDLTSDAARFAIAERAEPPRVSTQGPALCHLLLAYHLGPIPGQEVESGQQITNLLLDDALCQTMLNQTLLYRTRYGVRFGSAASPDARQGGESHRDLFLSTFAQIGVPLSTIVNAGHERMKLESLLEDSLATYDPRESEIAWTAIAYAFYLHGQQQWENRDGRTFSFDDLATELGNRPLNGASCGGVHILMAMTYILRSDAQQQVLSPTVRQHLVDEIGQYVADAAKSQSPDGTWTIGWSTKATARPIYYDSPEFKLLVTGHLLEWLEYLPKSLQPHNDLYARGVRGIRGVLTACRAARSQDAQFCPWTHATSAILNLVDYSSAQAVTQSR